MQNMKYTLVLITVFFFPFIIFSQSFEAGVWLGGTNSFNDLNTRSSFKTSRPAGGVLAKFNMDNRLSAELMASYGKTYSSDQALGFTAFHEARNEASKTSAFDLSTKLEFNFFPFDISGDYLNENSNVTPYLGVGVGITSLDVEVYSRVEDDYVPATFLLREDSQKLNSIQAVVPLTAGVKFKLSDHFVLAGEFGARILFTDYYDNVSTVYNQIGVDHGPGTITSVGSQRGDSSRNDQYNLFGAKLTYLIPNNSCPKINRK